LRVRVVKWLAGIAAGLVLLVVIAIVIIVTLVDPNRFKGRIETSVREATGYPFKIDGDLDIAWYPWIAVRTGPARLGKGEPLVQWESARVGARLIPLLRGELVVGRIRLDGLQLRLRRFPDGRANWDALLANRKQSSGSAKSSLEIAGVQIRRGLLDYRDEQKGGYLKLADWALDFDEWRAGKPFSVDTRFVLQYGAARAAPIPVGLQARRIGVRTEPLAVSVPEFKLRLAEAELGGSVGVQSTSPLRGAGALVFETESLREWLKDLGIGGPRPLDATTLGAFRMATRWVANEDGIEVKPIDLRVDRTTLNGELSRSDAAEPIWRFDLHGDRIELDRYVKLEDTDDEPFELPVKELKAIRAQGVLHFDEARLADAVMRNVRLRLELDDGELRGAAPHPTRPAP
jgi:AsmA protein